LNDYDWIFNYYFSLIYADLICPSLKIIIWREANYLSKKKQKEAKDFKFSSFLVRNSRLAGIAAHR